MSAALDLLARDVPPDAPAGFRLLDTGGGFNLLFGAVYGCLRDGKVALGFRVSPRHINPHGTCHGGVLATFADFGAYSAQREARLGDVVTPTVSMSMDFVAPARLGDWIETRTELLRATRTMMFTQSVASVGDRVVFRSSGVFKIGRPADGPGSTLGDAFAEAEERET